jgi:hypothetical protein
LELLRNRFYARHGHVFKRSDLNAYFSRQPWYKPRPEVGCAETSFSKGELADAHAILDFQNRRARRALPLISVLFDETFRVDLPDL